LIFLRRFEAKEKFVVKTRKRVFLVSLKKKPKPKKEEI